MIGPSTDLREQMTGRALNLRGLARRAVAKHFGVSESAWARYRSGRARIPERIERDFTLLLLALERGEVEPDGEGWVRQRTGIRPRLLARVRVSCLGSFLDLTPTPLKPTLAAVPGESAWV